MAAEGVTTIGARLVLSGAAAFQAAAAKSAASIDALTASIDRSTAVSRANAAANDVLAASNAKVAASAGIAKDASIGTTDAVVASDVAIAASTKTVAASTVANDGAAAAVRNHSTALTGLAKSNPLMKASMWGGAALLAWGYESIKWTTTLQKNLTLLQTQAGMTAAGMKKVGLAAMANPYGATPEAFSAAAYAPASTGFNAADTIAIVNNAQKESIISGSNLTDTVNSLTSTMKSYDLHAGSAAKTQATLNSIVGAGNMHFQDFNKAMASGIASTSALYGVSLPSMGAAIAYMTDRGTPADEAATRLRMTTALMASPSKEAARVGSAAGLSVSDISTQTSGMTDALKLAGVEQLQLANDMRKPDGLMVALQDLKTHMDAGHVSTDMQNAALSKMFGGGRSGSTAAAMFGNLPGVAAKYNQIVKGSTTKAFDSDYTTALKTQSGQLKMLDSNWHKLSITIGRDFLPISTSLSTGLSDTLGWLSKNSWAVGVLGTAVTAILVPAMGLKLYRAFGQAGRAIGDVTRLYGSAIRAITGHRAALALDDAALATNAAAANADAAAQRNLRASLGLGLAYVVPAVVATGVGYAAGKPGNPISNTENRVGTNLTHALGLPPFKNNPKGDPNASFMQRFSNANVGNDIHHWSGSVWHGLFGGGGAPTPNTSAASSLIRQAAAAQATADKDNANHKPAQARAAQAAEAALTERAIQITQATNPHITVEIDGKAVFAVIRSQSAKVAARN